MSITEVKDLGSVFNLIKELRSTLTKEEYLKLAQDMTGYRVFVLEEYGVNVALAGFTILTNLYDGKHLYLYDLITKESDRSKGYGKKLMDYLENFAKDQGCKRIVLSSSFKRSNAHRFYESNGFKKVSYMFKKELT